MLTLTICLMPILIPVLMVAIHRTLEAVFGKVGE